MSLFDNNCNNVKPIHKCKGCACDVLKKLCAGSLVNIVLKGGDEFFEDELAFVRLDHKTCCATFLLEGYPFIIDCENIVGIQVLR
ncbi:hypothetical protein QUF49_12110 [Fictibacillus sp. b24]|uniref:hypothetical protein n=1 Tax=Fictibacillus sp. b24 TaxID=3055863 RepID=UPI0025A2AFDF|nr:hypothetical protein [Fictibacillus sp. b24]MDM5316742.1 hypothetical protein [Fictibacillus sp. b24]